jgi:hypothetical protein
MKTAALIVGLLILPVGVGLYFKDLSTGQQFAPSASRPDYSPSGGGAGQHPPPFRNNSQGTSVNPPRTFQTPPPRTVTIPAPSLSGPSFRSAPPPQPSFRPASSGGRISTFRSR